MVARKRWLLPLTRLIFTKDCHHSGFVLPKTVLSCCRVWTCDWIPDFESRLEIQPTPNAASKKSTHYLLITTHLLKGYIVPPTLSAAVWFTASSPLSLSPPSSPVTVQKVSGINHCWDLEPFCPKLVPEHHPQSKSDPHPITYPQPVNPPWRQIRVVTSIPARIASSVCSLLDPSDRPLATLWCLQSCRVVGRNQRHDGSLSPDRTGRCRIWLSSAVEWHEWVGLSGWCCTGLDWTGRNTAPLYCTGRRCTLLLVATSITPNKSSATPRGACGL